jgi:hypothetical protein
MAHDLASAAHRLLAAVVLVAIVPGVSAAQRRNPNPGDAGNTGAQAVPRTEARDPTSDPRPAPPASTPETPRQEPNRPTGRPTTPNAEPGETTSGSPRAGARAREGQPVAGTAVPRGSVSSPGANVVVLPTYHGYWPWGYGGVGFGYYSDYYGPYGYYDPFGYGAYPPATSTYPPEGSLRLKVKPRAAQVYVDGYFVGVVDEFDGIFQRLQLEAGPHRIEVRAPGFENLAIDVQIRWDRTTTVEEMLRRSP